MADFNAYGIRDLYNKAMYWSVQVANVYEIYDTDNNDKTDDYLGITAFAISAVADEAISDMYRAGNFNEPVVPEEDGKALIATHEIMHAVFGKHEDWWVNFFGVMANAQKSILNSWDQNVHPLAYPAIQNLLFPSSRDY